MVFDTFSGKSKCIHEEGTLPNEDPLISTPDVGGAAFPGDPVLFEVILSDQGEGSSSTFMLSGCPTRKGESWQFRRWGCTCRKWD